MQAEYQYSVLHRPHLIKCTPKSIIAHQANLPQANGSFHTCTIKCSSTHAFTDDAILLLLQVYMEGRSSQPPSQFIQRVVNEGATLFHLKDLPLVKSIQGRLTLTKVCNHLHLSIASILPGFYLGQGKRAQLHEIAFSPSKMQAFGWGMWCIFN